MTRSMVSVPLLESVIAVAERAGDRILQVYDTDFAVESKDDNTPLTAADLAAHACIEAGLGALVTQLPVLSEESADTPAAERFSWARYWLVDPLDGTREFVKRNGEFTVNIALVDDHEPVIGVVYVPVSGVCYFAGRGLGAYKRLPGAAPETIRARRRPDQGLTVASSRSHGNRATQDFVRSLDAALGGVEMVSMGSSLKSCLVAEGVADLYPRFGPTSEWDTAAAQCVVEEAGGHLTDTSLNALRYNTKDSLINPSFLVFGDAQFDWRAHLPAGHS